MDVSLLIFVLSDFSFQIIDSVIDKRIQICAFQKCKPDQIKKSLSLPPTLSSFNSKDTIGRLNIHLESNNLKFPRLNEFENYMFWNRFTKGEGPRIFLVIWTKEGAVLYFRATLGPRGG